MYPEYIINMVHLFQNMAITCIRMCHEYGIFTSEYHGYSILVSQDVIKGISMKVWPYIITKVSLSG